MRKLTLTLAAGALALGGVPMAKAASIGGCGWQVAEGRGVGELCFAGGGALARRAVRGWAARGVG